MGAEPAFGAESLDDADQHLLMELTGDLATPDDPSEVRKRTAVRLGRHLHLARAMFATFSATDGFTIDGEFHDRVRGLAGPHGLDILTTDAMSQLWAGRLVANDDLDRATSPALYPPAILATQTRSIVIVPLRYRGQLVAVFVMTRTHPHGWTRRELALASILAEHTWFASEHQRAMFALAEVEARNQQLVQHANESSWERVRTEAKLRALTDTLEEKVVSRTQELENAHAAITRSEANFRALITTAPYAVIVVQLDDRIAYANPAAVAMLCYQDASRLVGASYATVVHPDDRAKVAERIRREREKLPNPIEELRWCGKDGIEIWVEVSSLATEFDGKPASFAMARDVTARRKAEQELVASLRDKEILLREIHHRVKNNLQVVSSILAMQARLVRDDAARAQLDESQARVHSIGLVHEHLYRSEDLKRLDLRNYIHSLVDSLAGDVHGTGPAIEVTTDVEDLRLDVDRALACGLVVSELVTNALKHAFTGRAHGRIGVTMKGLGDEIVLRVADDGIGLPPGFASRPTTTLGFELISAFVQRLNARLSIESGEGTTFDLRFPAS